MTALRRSAGRGGGGAATDRNTWNSSTEDLGRIPVRISNWRHKVWQPAADELGLPKLATPYVLRHTAASLIAQRGVPVSAAAAALGHDPAIFLRTYAHLYP